MSSVLTGYSLRLACAACGLAKVVRRFPTAAGLMPGDTLGPEHIGIFEKGCFRCGVCRFTVLNAPPLEPAPKGPTGWVPKKEGT